MLFILRSREENRRCSPEELELCVMGLEELIIKLISRCALPHVEPLLTLNTVISCLEPSIHAKIIHVYTIIMQNGAEA